jgi:hypothetical protein
MGVKSSPSFPRGGIVVKILKTRRKGTSDKNTISTNGVKLPRGPSRLKAVNLSDWLR